MAKFTPAGVLSAIKCRVRHNANQTISTSVVTILNFNTEDYDTGSLHDTVTNNDRITFPKAGKYRVFCMVNFDSNATGHRVLGIVKNGVTSIVEVVHSNSTVSNQTLNISFDYEFAANDYIYAQVFQDSGGNLDVRGNLEFSPVFGAELLQS